MTTNRFRVHLTSLLLVAGLSSCADHLKPEPGPDRLRVKTLTEASSDAPGIRKVSALTYDGQGRLSAILAYQSPDSTLAPVEQNTYQYDELNRLTKHRRQFYRRPLITPSSLPDLLYEEEQYVYGPTGPPTQLLYFNNTAGGPLWYTVDLAYSSTTGRLLTARQRLAPTNGVSYRVYRTFTYTGDNITSVDADYSLCAMGGPCNTGLVTSVYTFDDKLNPFYGVYVIPIPTGRVIPVLGGILTTEDYYGGVDNLFNLSRNNVLTGNGPVYTYTYNSANLPTSRSTTDRFGLTTTLTFAYEAY